MDKRRIQLRWFEACVALAVIAAFAVIGPLRGTFTPIPWVMLLCTLILFLTPGALLVRWFWRDYFFGAALAPAAFVTSVGLFALLALPMLILQSTLDAYLWACGTIVAACWLAAVVLAFRPEQPEEGHSDFSLSDRGGSSGCRSPPSSLRSRTSPGTRPRATTVTSGSTSRGSGSTSGATGSPQSNPSSVVKLTSRAPGSTAGYWSRPRSPGSQGSIR